jgi:uncharacterized CHY-type Zn-finger protein
MSLWKDAGHLIRLAIVMAMLVIGFFALRQAFVPEGFGKYGHYRAGALDDIRARPINFAGRTACNDCHVDQVALKLTGKHAKIACEACHGPLEKHTADISIKPALPEAVALCSRCHEALVARPKGFPQVATKDHAAGNSCTLCHKPHAPKV